MLNLKMKKMMEKTFSKLGKSVLESNVDTEITVRPAQKAPRSTKKEPKRFPERSRDQSSAARN